MNLFFMRLEEAAKRNQTRLCVGLDPRTNKIPEPFCWDYDPILSFNKAIIDEAAPHACAFKPNFAFYEAAGLEGINALKKTIDYIPPEIPVIADAKRGDIGSTAEAYARAIFEYFRCDAVTLNPLLGEDSLSPFLNYQDKGLYILCLTSNPGSEDFQVPNSLHEQIARKTVSWNQAENCGLVVGATKPEYIQEIRAIVPEISLLIPGIGAQGGDLKQVLQYAPNSEGTGYIINVSRGISQPPGKGDFQRRVAEAAARFKQSINQAKEN